MNYAMSDIHGCYDKYLEMLQVINFSDDDVLYILGDVVDRGDKPMELLWDMSLRSNVFPIMGNHDYFALNALKKLNVVINSDNYASQLSPSLLKAISGWMSFDGGNTTLEGFKKLDPEAREAILEYLEEFSAYEIAECGGKTYLLTHAGLPKIKSADELEDCDIREFLTAKNDYSRKYFKNTVLVTGHIPTFTIDEAYRGKIYNKNNHLAIDTGAVFGEKLACVCLDTGAEFYV